MGRRPKDWKTANITPIHKKGPQDIANNYRPISLTSIPCKLLEHVVLRNLNTKINAILHQRQHGFRRGLSCETQLCSTLNDIMSAIEDKNTVHALVLDFSKAFDKVPHSLLIEKLSAIPNIDSYLIDWIHNFLLQRTQHVVLNGTKSAAKHVSSGVPQGSVLGPILFLIYINDLPDSITSSVSLFADDTFLFQVVNYHIEAKTFQTNIDALWKWSATWGMEFNITKCHIMGFNAKETLPQYTLGGKKLNQIEETRYLGVTLQANLSFDSYIFNKLSRAK